MLVKLNVGCGLGDRVPIPHRLECILPGRRPAYRGDRRRLGGLADVDQNPLHRRGLDDEGDDAKDSHGDGRESREDGRHRLPQAPHGVGARPAGAHDGHRDIFEALTARDRPYKPGKTLSQAIAIMAKMRDEAHIDPDLFELFLNAGVVHRTPISQSALPGAAMRLSLRQAKVSQVLQNLHQEIVGKPQRKPRAWWRATSLLENLNQRRLRTLWAMRFRSEKQLSRRWPTSC